MSTLNTCPQCCSTAYLPVKGGHYYCDTCGKTFAQPTVWASAGQEPDAQRAFNQMWTWLESRRSSPDFTTIRMVQGKLLELFGYERPMNSK